MLLPYPARRTSRLLLPLLVLLLFLVSACDTAEGGGGTITLPEKEVEFEFRFNIDQPVGGSGRPTSVSILPEDRVDISSQLEGFQKSEVISVTVTSIDLERVQPTDRPLSELMERVELEIDATSEADLTIGEQGTLPATRETSLDILAADITDYATRPDFGATLNINSPDAGSYVLVARLGLRIEVEDI